MEGISIDPFLIPCRIINLKGDLIDFKKKNLKWKKDPIFYIYNDMCIIIKSDQHIYNC